MWFAFTMDDCIADADTKRDLIADIQTGYEYRIKRLGKGFYQYEHKEDDGFWYEKFYLCSSVQVAKEHGFGDQLKEYLQKALGVPTTAFIREEAKRTPATHELKILPEYFNEVMSHNKQFELRKDDRDYQVGDFLLLKEFENGSYTGRESGCFKVSYILRNCPEYGLADGYCILGW